MGETALYQAVEMEKINQIDTLVKHGADPNLARNDGWTPLHAATLKQNIPIVELLLKNGSNPNIKTKFYGQTAVHFAIKSSVKPAILLLLVQYNGSLIVKDKYDKRPIDYAETPEMKETISILKMQKEEAFYTPQKERVLNINGNNYSIGYTQENISNVNNSGSAANNVAFTPPRTTNYIFNKLVIKTASNKKSADKNEDCSFKKEKLKAENKVQNESNTKKENRNSGVSSNPSNTQAYQHNHPFSPSDYAGTNTLHDAKFDSFITKEGFGVFSKVNTPREDGGISDMNPLDTINSNYNNITNQNIPTGWNCNSNNISPNQQYDISEGKNVRKEDFSHLMYINLVTGNNNSAITEYENEAEDSASLKKLNDDSLNIEEANPEEFTDDLEYSQSKASGLISDMPVTSSMKRNDKESSNKDKIVVKKLNFGSHVNPHPNSISTTGNYTGNIAYLNNKIKYHNKENSNPNTTNNNLIYEPNSSEQKKNEMYSLTNHHINNTCVNPINNPSNYSQNYSAIQTQLPKQKINLSPNYKRKLNFSNIPTDGVEEERMERLNTGNYKVNSTSGANSTRHNSSAYNFNNNFNNTTEENLFKKLGKRKIYLNDTNVHDNSNKTIIHVDSMNNTLSQGCPTIHTCGNIHHGLAVNNTLQNQATNSNQKYQTKSKKIKKISILSEFSKKNSLHSLQSPNKYLETVYCITETDRSNISTQDAKTLHEWLNKIGMQNYYNNFLEKGVFNIGKVIDGMTDTQTRITYKDLEEMGVRKPGHIYRILTQLEIDAKMIDENLVTLILKTNLGMSKGSNNTGVSCNLKISSEKTVCCGIFEVHKVGECPKNLAIGSNPFSHFDLISWLKKINLPYLRKNFIHNGFDSIEFFILQMFSLNPFDDAMIEDSLHIYNKKERRTILSQLIKDVKLLNQRLYNNTNRNSYSNFNRSNENDRELDNFSEYTNFEKKEMEEGCKMCIIF